MSGPKQISALGVLLFPVRLAIALLLFFTDERLGAALSFFIWNSQLWRILFEKHRLLKTKFIVCTRNQVREGQTLFVVCKFHVVNALG